MPGPETHSWNQWENDLQKTSEQYTDTKHHSTMCIKAKSILYIYINRYRFVLKYKCCYLVHCWRLTAFLSHWSNQTIDSKSCTCRKGSPNPIFLEHLGSIVCWYMLATWEFASKYTGINGGFPPRKCRLCCAHQLFKVVHCLIVWSHQCLHSWNHLGYKWNPTLFSVCLSIRSTIAFP